MKPTNNDIHFKEHLSIKVEELVQAVPTFPTKKAAIAKGREFGWPRAIRVFRRFETVWIVGDKSFQGDYEAGVQIDVFNVPMLRFENGAQPILKIRRAAKR